MEWLTCLNEAIKYIEENLEDEIDIERTAQIACCSAFHFQRMFSYLADVPLSEYIRRRKMTKAAFDLRGGGEKIIDIALKYGYESPTSFKAAGVEPTPPVGGSFRRFSPCCPCLASARLRPPLRKSLENFLPAGAWQFYRSGFSFRRAKSRG
jgi:AraC-like DNA-binding protein